MPLFYLAGVLVALTACGYFLGRSRAVHAASGAARPLHSLPGYYGLYVALWCGIPGIAVVVGWLVLQPFIVEQMVLSGLGARLGALSPEKIGLVLNEIENLAAGNAFGSTFDPAIQAAAERLNRLNQIGHSALFAVACALSIAGLAIAGRHVTPAFRSRIHVERAAKFFLIACSLVAIVTTVGIVLSLVFESLRFFGKVPVSDFLFGL